MSAGRKISRHALARFVADRLQAGAGKDAITQAAAYLIETKQTHAVDLLVRDIEELLAENGTVVADLTSARALSPDEKNAVAKLLDAKHFYARETVDPAVLGGIRIETAGKQLDATLKHRITSLKEIDSRKGTT